MNTLKAIKIAGPDAADFLHRLTTQDIRSMKSGEKQNAALLNGNSQIQHLFTIELRDEGFFLWVDKERASKLAEDFEKLHFTENLNIEVTGKEKLGDKFSEEERIEKGLFKFGKDITEKNLILEAPLNSYLHRNKGCYPGQEVVERVFTYGQMAKKLVGIRLSHPVSTEITLNGKKVGSITSATTKIALALIQKPHYKNGALLDQGKVFSLPDSF